MKVVIDNRKINKVDESLSTVNCSLPTDLP